MVSASKPRNAKAKSAATQREPYAQCGQQLHSAQNKSTSMTSQIKDQQRLKLFQKRTDLEARCLPVRFVDAAQCWLDRLRMSLARDKTAQIQEIP